MRFRLTSEFNKVKTQQRLVEHVFEVNTGGEIGEQDLYVNNEMSESSTDQGQVKAVTRCRQMDKDNSNECEPEISFSKLNISPKPLHARPTRNQTKASSVELAPPPSDSSHKKPAPLSSGSNAAELSAVVQPLNSAVTKDNTNNRAFTRCLRSRVRQNQSIKVGSVESKSSTSLVNAETNNNYLSAQFELGCNPAHYAACCDNTILTMAFTQVPRKNRSRPSDSASLCSVASDEFNESDEELISINGDASSDFNQPIKSPRLSSKRKRTTTLSADLEVESLLSPTVEDSLSSCGDNFSDCSETEELVNCEIPRKRLCSMMPTAAGDRPYLDLEKMQDKVEKAASMSNKLRPRAIRIMYFRPIKNSGMSRRSATRSQVYNNRELVMSTRLCPLTPVEFSEAADCYS